MATSYLPTSDAARVTWLNNFNTKMQLYGSQLGFSAAELSSITDDANMFQYVVQLKNDCRQAAQSFSSLTQALKSTTHQSAMNAFPPVPVAGTPPVAVLTGIFARVAAYVQRIRYHVNYTVTIGQELSIIPPPSTFNPATVKPVLKGKVLSGYPQLSWRNGRADGVQLYVDRQDGNGYVLLAKRNSTSYIDVTPLPANTQFVTWLYKAKYIIDDEEIGLDSDIISLEILRV